MLKNKITKIEQLEKLAKELTSTLENIDYEDEDIAADKNKFKDILVQSAHLPIDDQYNALNKAFLDWKGNQEQVDDVLVIGVKI